jgi:hypothetical protein
MTPKIANPEASVSNQIRSPGSKWAKVTISKKAACSYLNNSWALIVRNSPTTLAPSFARHLPFLPFKFGCPFNISLNPATSFKYWYMNQ